MFVRPAETRRAADESKVSFFFVKKLFMKNRKILDSIRAYGWRSFDLVECLSCVQTESRLATVVLRKFYQLSIRFGVSFLNITSIIGIIPMEHVYTKNSLESQLHFRSVCSVWILARIWVIDKNLKSSYSTPGYHCHFGYGWVVPRRAFGRCPCP